MSSCEAYSLRLARSAAAWSHALHRMVLKSWCCVDVDFLDCTGTLFAMSNYINNFVPGALPAYLSLRLPAS